ncbi:MAG: DNA mismatch repair protein MutH [Succinivibrio sp.]
MTRTNQKLLCKSPKTFEELIANLDSIMGKTIAELAKRAQLPLPISPTHGKGFTGELLEIILGASAQNLPIPDFPELGLELKTIPVNRSLEPLESTFLCHAPLTNIRSLTFENSALYSKILRVLFILISAEKNMDFTERKIEGYFFFTPDDNQLKQLRCDFNELYELVKTGCVNQINARLGQIIQMRPKAANGQALTECIGPDGEVIRTRPRGFYMRREFTKKLIEKYLRF